MDPGDFAEYDAALASTGGEKAFAVYAYLGTDSGGIVVTSDFEDRIARTYRERILTIVERDIPNGWVLGGGVAGTNVAWFVGYSYLGTNDGEGLKRTIEYHPEAIAAFRTMLDKISEDGPEAP